MYRTDNPIADFEAYEWDQERERRKRPRCAGGHRIQDDYCYEINGELLCEDCLNKRYRKWTEDYME